MKIAVIGSGISGMATAYYLSRKYDVYLFEASDRLGGHTNTIEVDVESGKYFIDTGFIVFNSKNYPHFSNLINELGVEFQKTIMSFSVKDEKTGLEYNGTNLNSLFCQRKNLLNPKFIRMIFDIMRFNKEASTYYHNHIKHNEPDLITIEQFVKSRNYSKSFIEHYLIPMGAALWSASREEMRKFPLNFFVRFFFNHGMLTIDVRPKWQVIKGGSHQYIPKITKPYARNIYLNSEVIRVRRCGEKVEVSTRNDIHSFDQVVMSTHANQTLSILESPSVLENEILSNFRYRPNNVLLHTDTSILPKNKLAWASWNYYLPNVERERVAVTYDMNILQSINSPETFLVSLNMDDLIDPKKVLKKINYSHPIFDLGASNSQKRWSEISGKNRIHYAGAYWGNGFHEDGVKSAFEVARTLGAI